MSSFITVKQQRQPIIQNFWSSLLILNAFALILFGIKLWLISSYGNATPYWDQWDAEAVNLYKPFLDGTLEWADLFGLHNEHRIVSTRILTLSLLNINGIWNPMLQMVVNAILHIVTLVFAITLLSRVIGRNHLPALLVFSFILFGIPYAWANTLVGFQSQFYFVLLFSIASMWLTVTQVPLSVRWWGGVYCAMFAFLSLASGIFALAAAAIIGMVFYVIGLRKTRKQLLAIVILAGLFIVGVVLTPSLVQHEFLKATSFSQFLGALIKVLGWPISSNFFSALIRNLPALVFVSVIFLKRPPANDRKWFLLALVVWMLGQTLSIAYGRAVGSLSSRYLDLFAVGILVNFVCLISIAQEYTGRQNGWKITGVSFWIFIVLISLLLHAGKDSLPELNFKRDSGLAQEINTRNYLATGNINHLKDKPYLHVPYPNSERLASILSSPTILAILPANIGSPLMPALIESKPRSAFVANGYFTLPPERIGMTLGSYNSQYDVTTGQATMQFDNNKRGTLLEIPVAGYPLSSGIKLEIEQNGKIIPVILKSNPKKLWGTAFVKIDTGTFSINLIDSSPTNWLAIGAPVVRGRYDAFINVLLSNYHLFILLGLMAIMLLLIQYVITIRAVKTVGK